MVMDSSGAPWTPEKTFPLSRFVWIFDIVAAVPPPLSFSGETNEVFLFFLPVETFLATIYDPSLTVR